VSSYESISSARILRCHTLCRSSKARAIIAFCHVPCIISPHSGQSWDAYRSPAAHEMQSFPPSVLYLKTSFVAAAVIVISFSFFVLMPSGQRSLCPACPIMAIIRLVCRVMLLANYCKLPAPSRYPAIAKHKVFYVTLCPVVYVFRMLPPRFKVISPRHPSYRL